MSKIYITGAPGSGKTTIGKILKKKGYLVYDLDNTGICNWQNINTGAYINHHQPTQQWLNQHNWNCDIDKLHRLISNQKDVIIVGTTSNQKKYFYFFDKVILLTVNKQLIIERLKTRAGNHFGKTHEEQQHVLS